MIRQIRNTVFVKVLLGLMGLYLLNISVDMADPNPEHIPEDLSINDQESIIEIVVEKILGFENAFKEYDDNDTKDSNKKTNSKVELKTLYTNNLDFEQVIRESKKRKFLNNEEILTNSFQKLDTPPPQI